MAPKTPKATPKSPKKAPKSPKTSPKKAPKSPKSPKSPKKSAGKETRARKKARQALDLMTGKKLQRQSSLQNVLGKNLKGPSRKTLEFFFRTYDVDGDGHITSDELAASMRSMGKRPLTRHIQRILEECDTDKNGTIELEEFVVYFQKLAAAKNKGKRSGGNPKKDDGADDEPSAKKAKKAVTDPADTVYAIEKLIQSRSGKKGLEYLVKWEGYADKDNTWEPAANIDIAGNEELIEELEAGNDEDDEAPSNGSIAQYYNQSAGLHVLSGAAMDKHGNLEGNEYDLGQEGAFESFSILIGSFYKPLESQAAEFDLEPVKAALASKGFSVKIVQTEAEFVGDLEQADVAWVLSHKFLDGTVDDEKWNKALSDFVSQGGGLWIWAENAPWLATANRAVEAVFGPEYKLEGNTPASQVLALGDGTKGTFCHHLVTTGITSLFEGRTVCYMNDLPDQLVPVATSTDDKPVILVSDPSKSAASMGRVAVDCGFTKLWVEWNSAGTARYVKNMCVWLLGLDHRIANNAPLKGKLTGGGSGDQVVWEYEHNGWHKYDAEASVQVEAVYQEFVRHPGVDGCRDVKSGHWHYRVDFNAMTQENMQHHAHTKRKVRRGTKATTATPFGF